MWRQTDGSGWQTIVVWGSWNSVCLPEIRQSLGIQADIGRVYHRAGTDWLGFCDPVIIHGPTIRLDQDQYFPIFFKFELLCCSEHGEHILVARIGSALGQGQRTGFKLNLPGLGG